MKKARVPSTKNTRKGKVAPMQKMRKGGGSHPRVGSTADHMGIGKRGLRKGKK